MIPEEENGMKFWKMHGEGNDFIIINNMVEKIPHERLPEIVRTLCRRRFSIGADGFIVVDRPEKAATTGCSSSIPTVR